MQPVDATAPIQPYLLVEQLQLQAQFSAMHRAGAGIAQPHAQGPTWPVKSALPRIVCVAGNQRFAPNDHGGTYPALRAEAAQRSTLTMTACRAPSRTVLFTLLLAVSMTCSRAVKHAAQAHDTRYQAAGLMACLC